MRCLVLEISGMIIIMEELMAHLGLVPLPSIYDYWQKGPVFHFSPFADKISRDRLCEIQRFLHFATTTYYNLMA